MGSRGVAGLATREAQHQAADQDKERGHSQRRLEAAGNNRGGKDAAAAALAREDGTRSALGRLCPKIEDNDSAGAWLSGRNKRQK